MLHDVSVVYIMRVASPHPQQQDLHVCLLTWQLSFIGVKREDGGASLCSFRDWCVGT